MQFWHVKKLGALFGVLAIPLGVLPVTAQPSLAATTPQPAVAAAATGQPAAVHKINFMGAFAHPDDDTSLFAPCAVWNEHYGKTCGVMAMARGEGGTNSAGSELGPTLGLRRENEERLAHYREGTVDFFFADANDFWYTTSAPVTEYFWGHDKMLSRVTRIIRQTQPDIIAGHPPTQSAGHGHHQWTGRLVWEGVNAAADPTMFPEQLDRTKDGWLNTWQVKKVTSGGTTTGTGGTTTSADCNTGFLPAATNFDAVAGVWTGYDTPYLWPEGNYQGKPAGSPKIAAQLASEGSSAYVAQSRTMVTTASAPACSRFGVGEAFVPFQPNKLTDGTANPLAGKDDAIFYGATIADPGGLPVGTTEFLTFNRFFNVVGQPFQATLHVRSGSGILAAGNAALTVPDGWSVDGPKTVGPISDTGESTVTFNITPSANAAAGKFKISALLTSGSATGYTDNVMQIVPAVEGRSHRFGNWADYDQWLAERAPQAYRLNRSAAIQSMGVGESIKLPIDVHNWSTSAQSGTVSIAAPDGFTLDAASKSYGPLAAGADTQVVFTATNTDTTKAPSTAYLFPVTTAYGTNGESASETLSVSLVPTTTIPKADTDPALDAKETPGEYTGTAIDIGKTWQGNCTPVGVDCGTTPGVEIGDPLSSYAKITWRDDNLYVFAHVRDEYQSYAIKSPDECFAHLLADSVEIMIDPRGNGAQLDLDTAAAFKLGIFPYSNDPTNINGNGVNGPCWWRSDDNHNGFSTGPLSTNLVGGPNAPGVKVVSSVEWAGDNLTTTDHSYTGGAYNVEVKIPMADLPAAVGPTSAAPTGDVATNTVDPQHMGFNITPYDNDNTAAAGTTLLRHIESGQARLGWSTFGSINSNPHLWGHAFLSGYTPPAGRSTAIAPAILQSSALDSTDSPQSIYNSTVSGVPLSGRAPVQNSDKLQVQDAKLTSSGVTMTLKGNHSGRAHVFLYAGDGHAIPVYNTSCTVQNDPWPDWGFTPCQLTDGTIADWQPDMHGRHLGDSVVNFTGTETKTVTLPLDAAAIAKAKASGKVMISFNTPDDEVQAMVVALAAPAVTVAASTASSTAGDEVTVTATVKKTDPFSIAPTGRVQFTANGKNIGSPIALKSDGSVSLTTDSLPAGTLKLQATYLGDLDYISAASATTQHVVAGRDTSTIAVIAPDAIQAGATANIAVRVTGPGGTPTGTVKITEGSKTLVTRPLTSGRANATVGAGLTPGIHTLTITYTGDISFASSTDTVTLTVRKATPTVTATLGRGTVSAGTRAQMTVITRATGLSPTGTITVRDNGQVIKSVPLTAAAKGKAIITLPVLAPGAHRLTATYGGNAFINAANARIITLTVTKAKPSVTAKLADATITTAQAPRLTVTVKAAGFLPTGRITVKDGGRAIKAVQLSAGNRGTFAITLRKLKAGPHALTAQYAGNAQVAAATSVSVILTVSKK